MGIKLISAVKKRNYRTTCIGLARPNLITENYQRKCKSFH